MPIMQEGLCCSPLAEVMDSFYSENMLLYHPALFKDFYLSYALFNFFAAQWYLQSLQHYVMNGYTLSPSAA